VALLDLPPELSGDHQGDAEFTPIGAAPFVLVGIVQRRGRDLKTSVTSSDARVGYRISVRSSGPVPVWGRASIM
jgi:hypothetical protein